MGNDLSLSLFLFFMNDSCIILMCLILQEEKTNSLLNNLLQNKYMKWIPP